MGDAFQLAVYKTSIKSPSSKTKNESSSVFYLLLFFFFLQMAVVSEDATAKETRFFFGFVEKQGAIVRNWKRRWFVLTDHTLR